MGSGEKSGPPWLLKKDSEPVYLQEPRPEHHPLPQAKENLVLGFKPGNSEPSAAACEVAWPRVPQDRVTERAFLPLFMQESGVFCAPQASVLCRE